MKLLIGVLAATGVAVSLPTFAAGVAPGTVITNTATVDFTVGGTPFTQSSTPSLVTVDELIDVTVTWQNGSDVQVAAGSSDQGLLFRVTNTGNGNETYTLSVTPNLSGDNFDATNARIYFDTDSSGDFSVGDTLYVPGTNDPTLASGAHVDVLIVSDIPGALANGNTARARLTATSKTGTGTPGTALVGAGDGGVDAVLGSSGGKANAVGIYIIQDVGFTVIKRATVTDPRGGNQPITGATIQYTIKITPTGSATATNAVVTDAIPANTTYVPSSLMLNGSGLTDAGDADAGDYNVTTPGAITVALGTLTGTSSVQVITFTVRIN